MVRCSFCKQQVREGVTRCPHCSAKRGFKVRNRIVSRRDFVTQRVVPAVIGALTGGLGAIYLPVLPLFSAMLGLLATVWLLHDARHLLAGPRWWRRA